MKDFMTLGPVPFEEECIQVSPEVDYTEMRNEVVKYVNLLQERFVNIPENAYFGIKRESHDFGTYFEAAVYWDTEDADSQAFAYFVENRLPASWKDDAKLDWKTPVPAGWAEIDQSNRIPRKIFWGFFLSYGNTITTKFYQKNFTYALSYCLQCVILEVVRNHREIIMNKITIETELTQAQIADIMGVKQPQVSNWLNGKRLPTSQNLIKLANILNYYPEELLNDLVEIQKQNQA